MTPGGTMGDGAGPGEPSDDDIASAVDEAAGSEGGGRTVRRRDEAEPAAPTGPPRPRRWMVTGDTQQLVDPGAAPTAAEAAPVSASAGPTVILPRRTEPAYVPPSGPSVGSRIVTVLGFLVFLALAGLAAVLIMAALDDEEVGLASGQRVTLDGRSSPVTSVPGVEPQRLYLREVSCAGEPCLAAAHEQLVFVFEPTATAATVTAYDLAGDERWSEEVPGATVAPVAGIGDVLLVVTIAPDGTVETRALAVADGREVWTAFGTVLTFVDDDVILTARRAAALGVEEGRRLLRIDAVTGRNEWQLTTSSPVLAFGDGAMASLDGAGMRVTDLDSGRERWTTPVAGGPTAVAIGDGVAMVGVGDEVRAFSLGDGEPRWETEVAFRGEEPQISSMGVAAELLIVAAGDEVVGVEIDGRGQRWRSTTETWGDLSEGVVLDEERVLTATAAGPSVALLSTGAAVGDTGLEGAAPLGLGGPVVAFSSERLLVFDPAGEVRAVGIEELSGLWGIRDDQILGVASGSGYLVTIEADQVVVWR